MTRKLVEGALYQLPVGIVGVGGMVTASDVDQDGAILHTESEWRAYESADYTIDAKGTILFQGQSTGWSVDDMNGTDLSIGCVYCHEPVWPTASVPAVTDDAAWTQLAESDEHKPNCEWVVTRAHQIDRR